MASSRSKRYQDLSEEGHWDLEKNHGKRERSRSPGRPTVMADVVPPTPGAAPMAMQQGTDGGSGGGGGGGGANIEHEFKFGYKTKPYTKRFKRSFLCTANNGLENMSLERVAANPTTREIIHWNEGWQIIPWANLAAYLTPTDYFDLNTMNRKWRIKSTTVELEGIIPFQVDLTGGTNTTTSTFNNRINMHVYEDDGELLPDYDQPIQNLEHSERFTMPWGPGTTGALKSPVFSFRGAHTPGTYRYCIDPEFVTAKPQKFFSLYDTGCVKSVFPGQKFSKKWINENSQWMGRPPNGSVASALNYNNPLQSTAENQLARACEPSIEGGLTGRGPALANIPVDINSTNNSTCVYLDTGLPLKFEGPPYILVRVEPYPNLGAGGGLVNIYTQFHLHYHMEVECMPLEKPRTYVPFKGDVLAIQNSMSNFEVQIGLDTRVGITDNVIHRAGGPNTSNVIYT